MSEGINPARLYVGLALLVLGLVGFIEQDAISEKMTSPAPPFISRIPVTSLQRSIWPESDNRHIIAKENEERWRWHNEQTNIKGAISVVSGIVFFAGLGIAVFSLGGRKPTMR